jgi:pimeloyl-ACP methyl ester carboxylesterase
MRVVFVHGACVRDGSWWWHRTAELLAEQGVASEAPALPSCGETGESTGVGGTGLAEDVAAVRQALTAKDEPTVVVAHSYGGIVTAEAATGIDTVHHLLLVSSYLPEVGQSLSSFGDGEPPPSCNASTPARRAASWNSTPATTRSSPSRPLYATWSWSFDGTGLNPS